MPSPFNPFSVASHLTMNPQRPVSLRKTARSGGFRLTAMAVGLSLLGQPSWVQAENARGDAAGTRTVLPGESLSRIAESYCAPGERLCIRRHILAISRANPEQLGGSLGQLKVGDQLKIPSAQQIQEIPADEAMAVYQRRDGAPASPAPAPAAPAPVVPSTTVATLASPPRAAGNSPQPGGAAEPLASARRPETLPAVTAPAPVSNAARLPLAPAPAPSVLPPSAVAAAPVTVSPAAAVAATAVAAARPAAAPSGYQDETDAGQKTDFQSVEAEAPTGGSKVTNPAPTATAPPAPVPVPAAGNGSASGNGKTAEPPPAAPAPVVPAGRIRVPYIPETEKKRIRDELREEILETAKRENWAQPNAVPDWVKRMKFSADLLVRGEGQMYDRSNSTGFVNFQAVNSGAPVKFANDGFNAIPFLNTVEDRRLMRLRARMGMNLTVSPTLSMGLRLATGNASTPVSTNQTLGSNFNKLNLLLDRAYLRYQPTATLGLSLGRMPNPYASALDLVWDRDLSFDGVGLQWTPTWLGSQWRLAPGIFSVENTDPNYPGNSQQKGDSYDKWLASLQLEWSRALDKGRSLRASAAYYDFMNAEGQLSSRCSTVSDRIPCDSDGSRPGFVQKGNTLFAIRQPDFSVAGVQNFQYFGLVSKFQVLDFSAGFDMPLSGPLRLAIDGEMARNLAFDRQRFEGLKGRIFNNFSDCTGPCSDDPPLAVGADAYQAQLRVGYPAPRNFGDWQGQLGYRYVESDALLDAFTDSDFHLGGTNAKGYYLGGSVGFAPNAVLGLRYLSATEVSGPPLSVDLLQLDVSVKF